MTTPLIHIAKSPIPIVWIDTSIITKIYLLLHEPDKLDASQKNSIERLYELIYSHGRTGQIICPLADQESEVWVKREEWMDTIRNLSLGIECTSEKDMQDNQRTKAMQAYFRGKPAIELSYLDVFHCDPVTELQDVLGKPYFVTSHYDIIFGADYHREKNETTLRLLNESRELVVASGDSFDTQLKREYLGEFGAIVSMAKNLLEGKLKGEKEVFNAFGAYMNLMDQLQVWELISGKTHDLEGLIEFYRSEYHKKCPHVKLTCYLTAKIMTDPQTIKTGDTMDIKHISTLMPFSDLFITDKAWSAFLKRKKFDKEYGTTVCYVGDSGTIEDFFKNLIHTAKEKFGYAIESDLETV